MMAVDGDAAEEAAEAPNGSNSDRAEDHSSRAREFSNTAHDGDDEGPHLLALPCTSGRRLGPTDLA